jgi:hypothetical protein
MLAEVATPVGTHKTLDATGGAIATVVAYDVPEESARRSRHQRQCKKC